MKEKRFEHFYESADDIPLVLDSYDDIFSDFDPRPYSERAMSGDFLLECKKASAEKKKKIHLSTSLIFPGPSFSLITFPCIPPIFHISVRLSLPFPLPIPTHLFPIHISSPPQFLSTFTTPRRTSLKPSQ